MPQIAKPIEPGTRVRDTSNGVRGNFIEMRLEMYFIRLDDGTEGLYRRPEFVVIDKAPKHVFAGQNVVFGTGKQVWMVEAISDEGKLTVLSPGGQRRYDIDPEEVKEVHDADSGTGSD